MGHRHIPKLSTVPKLYVDVCRRHYLTFGSAVTGSPILSFTVGSKARLLPAAPSQFFIDLLYVLSPSLLCSPLHVIRSTVYTHWTTRDVYQNIDSPEKGGEPRRCCSPPAPGLEHSLVAAPQVHNPSCRVRVCVCKLPKWRRCMCIIMALEVLTSWHVGYAFASSGITQYF